MPGTRLDWAEKFRGSTFIVKLGGNAMVDPVVMSNVLEDVKELVEKGIKIVLVHGGGPEISRVMEQMGKNPVFIKGLRVTDDETMRIVKMVLVGGVNTDIVTMLNRIGVKSIGFNGKDANLIVAKKKQHSVDLGYVGQVEKINPHIVQVVMRHGYTPVIAPIGVSGNGETYNINADSVASALAVELKARKLVYITNVDGLYTDLETKQVISELTFSEAMELLPRVGTGMIPKLEACINAVKGKVEKIHIINCLVKGALSNEILTDKGIGTMIHAD